MKAVGLLIGLLTLWGGEIVNWFIRMLKKEVPIKEVTKTITKKFHKFPCSDDNCLVRMSCTQACDKLIMDDHKLMKAFLKYNCCSDCGSSEFSEGPSAGMSTNVRCAGCGHWFNFALPVAIERIHIDSNGVFR